MGDKGTLQSWGLCSEDRGSLCGGVCVICLHAPSSEPGMGMAGGPGLVCYRESVGLLGRNGGLEELGRGLTFMHMTHGLGGAVVD